MSVVSPEPRRRLFLALWPSEAERGALLAAAAQSIEAAGGRPVPAVNLHVTLAFLGSLDAGEMARVIGAADGIAGEAGTIEFRGVEYWVRSRVLAAVAARIDDALLELQSSLAAALRAGGIAVEQRSYRPHVTLVRDARSGATAGPFADVVTWRFDAFALAESVPGEPYRVLRHWPFVEGPSHTVSH